MKYDVFISYSRKDSEVADRVYNALTQAGISCFIDRQDINGGKEFVDVITESIDNSTLFLFLGSGNSYSAKYAPLEARYAFEEKKPESIIPYLIDRTPLPKKFRFYFGSINIRNIIDHPVETVLVDDVLALLGRDKAVAQAQPKAEKKPSAPAFNGDKVLKPAKEKHPLTIALFILQAVAALAVLFISMRLFTQGYVSKPYDWFLGRGVTWWCNLLLAIAAAGLVFATVQLFRNRNKAFYAVPVLDIVILFLIICISKRIFGVAQSSPKIYGKGAPLLYSNLRYVGYVFSGATLKPVELFEKIACYLLTPVHAALLWGALKLKKK